MSKEVTLTEIELKKGNIITKIKEQLNIEENDKLSSFFLSSILMDVYENSWLHQQPTGMKKQDIEEMVEDYKITVLSKILLIAFINNMQIYSVFSSVKPIKTCSAENLFKILHGALFTEKYIEKNQELVRNTLENLAFDLKGGEASIRYSNKIYNVLKEQKLL